MPVETDLSHQREETFLLTDRSLLQGQLNPGLKYMEVTQTLHIGFGCNLQFSRLSVSYFGSQFPN